MNFFSMAWRNMKRNFTDYLAYFVSAVFAVLVFYIFTSIFYNEQFRGLSEVSLNMNVMFKISAVIVALFSTIFLWYSSNFFLRRRKKEIGTYSLLGMGKRQIGRMLFYENLIMGMLALVCGIGLGTLLSKFFIMMLLNLMQVAFAVKFSFVPIAIIRTVQVFAVLFVIISLYGYSLIYRFKLIDLFQAQQEGERAPKASTIGAILAVLLVGGGYYLALSTFQIIPNLLIWAMTTIALTVAGTYVLFNSLIIMLIKWSKKRVRFYYRGTNMISTSQILYRIKGNARTLATIAVLSAVTITAVGTAYTYYRSKDIIIEESMPFSIQHKSDLDIDPLVERIIAQHEEVRLMSVDDIELVYVRMNVPQRINIPGYVMRVSQYNDILRHQKQRRQVTLAENECLIFESIATTDNPELLRGQLAKAMVGDTDVELQIVGLEKKSVLNMGTIYRMLIIPDVAYEKLIRNAETIARYRGYMLDDARSSRKLTADLLKEVPEEAELETYYEMFEWLFQSAGVIIFIGAFLGILFFLATGSIIYFKQLTEAYENRVRYSILLNLGVSQKEIKESVGRQLLLIFGLPLIVGIAHSGMALATLQSLVQGFSILWYVVATIGIYVLFYVAYYFFTVHSYLRVVAKGR